MNVTVNRTYITAEIGDHQLVSPSIEEVRAELERILASEAFANTGRLARLLRYVVERTLAGEGDQLKEYVLGVEVFDRGDQYDPRLDSIVRVEARRLRAKLEDYYRNGGAGDRVLIAIPRGTYAPVFGFRPANASAAEPLPSVARSDQGRRSAAVGLLVALTVAAMVLVVSSIAWRTGPAAAPQISVAVLPFEQHTGTPEAERLASRLTDTITSELARLGSVSVVSRTSARQFEGTRTPLRVIAETLKAEMIVEGTVESTDEQIKVTARLVNAATDRKVWADVFTAPASDVAGLSRRIALATAQAITTRKTP